MEIYEIEKNLFRRTEDCLNVLSWKDDPTAASRVRSEWAYHVELQIEPTGWQGLWKIPRAICEELKIKYPTFVFGMVQHVLFKELKAIFQVIAVQDDIPLPVEQEIHLEDIWVTKAQENTAMNIERTAEVLDSLRFFYKYIWMPWDNDNDDDLDWADKHLNSRIRFWYDLKNKHNMSRNLASRIKMLLSEARHIQERREHLELDFSDDDEPDGINKKLLLKNEISDLMKLHLRLAIIRNEVEILENPEMRKIYDEFKFGENKKIIDEEKSNVFIVAKSSNLTDHIKLMQSAEKYISNNKMVKICSTLQDALNICDASDTILLSPGQHYIKFLDHMNGNGQIIGLSTSNDDNNDLAEITCDNEFISNVLFIFNGGFTLKNLILNCNSIRTGILVKSCNNNVNLENCKIIGNKNFSTSQAIILNDNSKLSMSDCLIENFSTGVKLNDSSKIILNNSIIKKCHTGLEIDNDGKVEFLKNEIIDSKNYGILWETTFADNSKKEIFENFPETNIENVKTYPWKGNCLFKNNMKGNIAIMNTKSAAQKTILEDSLEDNLEDSIISIDDSDSQSFEECVNVDSLLEDETDSSIQQNR